MNRRDFVRSSLFAAALGPALLAESQRRSGGFKIPAGSDRTHEELLIMGGRFDCKVSGKDTAGELCIYDTVRHVKGGPALHRHRAQDEWFYVLRGEFLVKVGDEEFRLGPGDCAFAPRLVPHAFAMLHDGEGQMLVLFQPAGSMEDFFQQVAKFGRGIPQQGEGIPKQLWSDHGIDVLGPPLAV